MTPALEHTIQTLRSQFNNQLAHLEDLIKDEVRRARDAGYEEGFHEGRTLGKREDKDDE